MDGNLVNSIFDNEEILKALTIGEKLAKSVETVQSILERAKKCEGLSYKQAAVLLNVDNEGIWKEIYKTAKEIKEKIYGKRIVLFAPLYISNFCVNNCDYCGYKHENSSVERKKLTMEEIAKEVEVLQDLGHKRLALEVGEDLVNCSFDYVIESINTIYSVRHDNGSIRRINVNIAATTEENYRRLKDANIGTYILFQETYHKTTYQKVHKQGPKRDYNYHLTAIDRAMNAGIEDVGLGVLYGLYDYKYETTAMLRHAEYLESRYGIGPHTVSVPRLKAAENVQLNKYPLVTNENFKKIIAILRLSLPYVGMILSTREEAEFRDEVISLGISQISAGSCTGVGGYVSNNTSTSSNKEQFVIGDHRAPLEIIKSLIKGGYIPSYCTACYREGRTGDRFMRLAKTGNIHFICEPNALLTLKEFLVDYGDDEARILGNKLIADSLNQMTNLAIKNKTVQYLEQISSGTRDVRF